MNVYLAPHHDDLVLSLPFRLGAEGAGSLGVVVFSEEDDTMRAVCNRLHAGLGLEIVEMGFVEARRRGVSIRTCLRHSRRLSDIADEPLVDAVANGLEDILDGCAASTIIVPLLPIHVDHAIVRAAAERLARTRPHLRRQYYQEQPYAALWPESLTRETAGMVRHVVERRTTPGTVERLFEDLRPIVEQRDLDRVLQALQREPGEIAWEDTSRHTAPGQ